MSISSASAVWQGSLKDGKGWMRIGSGAFEGAYSFSSRFEKGSGTNPEELIGAAHAGCFSMALAHALEASGHPPNRISTTAKVHLEAVDSGFRITRIELETEGEVPGVDSQTFQSEAEEAKRSCPVSRLLSGAHIEMQARLIT